MKQIFFLFLVVVIYSCVGNKRINDDEFGFSITFPSKPNSVKSATEKSTSVEKSIKYESIVIENKDSMKYSIECFKISKFYYQKYSDRLERIIASIVLDVSFDPKSLISQENKSYSSYQGFQFTIKKDVNNYQTYKIFLINDNLYVISYNCPSSKLQNISLANFFDSFEVKGIKNNTSKLNATFKPYVIAFNRPTKIESTQRMTQNYGNIQLYVEVGEPREDGSNLNCGIVYTKLPISSDSISEVELDNLFKEFINGAVVSMPAKLLSENVIKFKSFPGRQIQMLWVVNNSNVIIETRYYMIKNYLFGIQVYYIEGKENKKETEEFYNSFEPKI